MRKLLVSGTSIMVFVIFGAVWPLNGSATTNTATVAIRVDQVGGFIGPNVKTARLPDVVLYTDGRVLAQHNVNGSVKQMFQKYVSASVLRSEITAFLNSTKVPSGGWGLPAVADVPSTEISVFQNGKKNVANVYALGFNSNNLSKAAITARIKLSKTINSLITFAGNTTIYKPSLYEVWPLWPASKATGTGIVWPRNLAPPKGICTSVAAKPFVRLLQVAGSKQWLLPNGQMISLTWRPVLPDEIACKR